MNGLGDRHSCHWQAVQTGEVGELLLRCVDGVASLGPVEDIRFCRQPIEILTNQLSSGVAEF